MYSATLIILGSVTDFGFFGSLKWGSEEDKKKKKFSSLPQSLFLSITALLLASRRLPPTTSDLWGGEEVSALIRIQQQAQY